MGSGHTPMTTAKTQETSVTRDVPITQVVEAEISNSLNPYQPIPMFFCQSHNTKYLDNPKTTTQCAFWRERNWVLNLKSLNKFKMRKCKWSPFTVCVNV